MRFSMRAGAILLLAVLGSFGCECETPAPEVFSVPHPALSLAEFQSYVKTGQAPVLDARDEQGYRAGHVPGALHLPPGGNFFNDYRRLGKILACHKNKLVIVYCDSQWCERADDLQMQLIAQGFQHVARFPGGWAEWQQAGLPVEKDSYSNSIK